jgi:hypothetical protein
MGADQRILCLPASIEQIVEPVLPIFAVVELVGFIVAPPPIVEPIDEAVCVLGGLSGFLRRSRPVLRALHDNSHFCAARRLRSRPFASSS